MVKEDIETIIDRLYEYVNQNGRVSVESAARAIALPPEKIERLATLLEKSGLIELQYRMTRVELVALEKDVTTTENVAHFMERDLLRRLAEAESELGRLERSGDFTPAQLDFLKKEVDIVLDQLHLFDAEIRKLNLQEADFEAKVQRFRQRVTSLDEKKRPRPRSLLQSLMAAPTELFASISKPKPAAKSLSVTPIPVPDAPKRPAFTLANLWPKPAAKAEAPRPAPVPKPAPKPAERKNPYLARNSPSLTERVGRAASGVTRAVSDIFQPRASDSMEDLVRRQFGKRNDPVSRMGELVTRPLRWVRDRMLGGR